MMPRARFIETMFLDVLAVCLATSFALLTSYCSARARALTPSSPPKPGSVRPGYNSSASVICAVWLFFQIYLANTFRAKFPRFTLPTVLFCILANVSCAYAPGFPTVEYGVKFCKSLLEVFLLALGVATGVHFLVFPVSMRTVALKEFSAFLGSIRGTLKAELAYFTSLQDPAMLRESFAASREGVTSPTPQAEAVRAAIIGLQGLHGKLHSDLSYAKREIAFRGNLTPDHLKEMYEMDRKVMLPTIGLSAIIDIFEHLSEIEAMERRQVFANSQVRLPLADEIGEDEVRKMIVNDWSEYMQHLHGHMVAFFGLIDEGIEHTLLGLRLKKPGKGLKDHMPSQGNDVEARAEDTRPGSKGFATYFDEHIRQYHAGKDIALRMWCEKKGIVLPDDFFDHPSTKTQNIFSVGCDESYALHQRKQRQLYLLLYMEYLINAVARGMHEYVKFADELNANGTFARKRIILPGKKRAKKWLKSIFQTSDTSQEDPNTGADIGGNTQNVELGAAYRRRKDPEHLPPEGWIEVVGNWIRRIPAALGSSQSAFGFRVACATISIALVAFVRQTQEWFVQQRGIWALIMVAISMNPTAGSSIFSYALRTIGTTVAMLAAWLVWYIPDEHTAGVLVFLWLWVSIGMYVPLKKPQFLTIGIISVVTTIMIIGYQLEARKVGIARATSNDQPYYKIYVFAPYRLATVIIGLATAFIWTIFPYPISEHSQIRKGLGGALYLLANYFSVIHELTRARIRRTTGPAGVKTSPGYQLERHRTKIFSKLMLNLTGLRTYASFLRYEIPVGGKFPRKQYDSIIATTSSLLNFMSLISYASLSFAQDQEEGSQWSNDFRTVLDGAIMTSRDVTTLLSLLSSSISNGQPMPPHLHAPQAYQLSQRLEAIDKDILSIRHINEPCYAAFAVVQISTRHIMGDLHKLLTDVREIVGELDFSFHTISTADLDTGSDITLWDTAKAREAETPGSRARKQD